MDYLNKVIEGKIKITEMYWYYNLYISENTEKVTAERIFKFSYDEGKKYDYSKEPKYKLAGKSFHT